MKKGQQYRICEEFMNSKEEMIAVLCAFILGLKKDSEVRCIEKTEEMITQYIEIENNFKNMQFVFKEETTDLKLGKSIGKKINGMENEIKRVKNKEIRIILESFLSKLEVRINTIIRENKEER